MRSARTFSPDLVRRFAMPFPTNPQDWKGFETRYCGNASPGVPPRNAPPSLVPENRAAGKPAGYSPECGFVRCDVIPHHPGQEGHFLFHGGVPVPSDLHVKTIHMRKNQGVESPHTGFDYRIRMISKHEPEHRGIFDKLGIKRLLRRIVSRSVPKRRRVRNHPQVQVRKMNNQGSQGIVTP